MKILLADDHPLFLQGVASLLKSQDQNLEFEYATSHAEFKQKLDSSIDLVITDLRMPGMSGGQFLASIIGKFKTTPFIVMSATESQRDVDAVIELGAMAFIPKSSPPDLILEKINAVIEGEIYHPRLSQLGSTTGEYLQIENRAPAFTDISERQLQVLKLMDMGLSNQLIARRLEISENTVKSHVRKLYMHFDAKRRVECLNKARSIGII